MKESDRDWFRYGQSAFALAYLRSIGVEIPETPTPHTITVLKVKPRNLAEPGREQAAQLEFPGLKSSPP
jgi:hypothetical protein